MDIYIFWQDKNTDQSILISICLISMFVQKCKSLLSVLEVGRLLVLRVKTSVSGWLESHYQTGSPLISTNHMNERKLSQYTSGIVNQYVYMDNNIQILTRFRQYTD